ncbi:LpqB family beta-propeller domain-containing protein [Streptomyces sp. NPDC060194]|uniref:LpqB family beta-propeller domain-containing protein n=1 Tax=Streptomyces sp. NPDC060194 TaxID=3347069 RepID=UPI00364BFC55
MGTTERAAAVRSAARAERRRAVAVVLACSGLLLAGCASMPDRGEVEQVKETGDRDSRVRVSAVPPGEGAPPEEIVQGFLDVLTSEDPRFSIARKYLTKEAAEDWRPEESATILTSRPAPVAGRTTDRQKGLGVTYNLTGDRIGQLDDRHAYRAAGGAYDARIHLTQVETADGKQWRIDVPPRGVVIGESDFHRTYLAVDKYYFAPGSARQAGGQDRLVADPVYLRAQDDLLTRTVRELLAGPTTWLDPVADSRFPSRTTLRRGTAELALDESNVLRVPLAGDTPAMSRKRCQEMAGQLFYTLRPQTANTLQEVQLTGTGGNLLCALDEGDAQEAGLLPGSDEAGQAQYFIDPKRRLVELSLTARNRGGRGGPGGEGDDEAGTAPVPGPLGTGEQTLRSAAVSRDERFAAGVSGDGGRLVVAPLTTDGELRTTSVTSRAKKEGDRLTAPSWDGRGDLWVADRDPGAPRLLRLPGGGTDDQEAQEVRVAGLGDDRIDAVRVAADGVRVALIVRGDDDSSTLQVGRIERRDVGAGEQVAVVELRPAAPGMSEVTAVSWAGGSRLVVAGRESGEVQQLRYVLSDGSAPDIGAALPGITGVKDIAASEDPARPLMASSNDGIVQLPSGSRWKTVVEKGSGPVYPG